MQTTPVAPTIDPPRPAGSRRDTSAPVGEPFGAVLERHSPSPRSDTPEREAAAPRSERPADDAAAEPHARPERARPTCDETTTETPTETTDESVASTADGEDRDGEAPRSLDQPMSTQTVPAATATVAAAPVVTGGDATAPTDAPALQEQTESAAASPPEPPTVRAPRRPSAVEPTAPTPPTVPATPAAPTAIDPAVDPTNRPAPVPVGTTIPLSEPLATVPTARPQVSPPMSPAAPARIVPTDIVPTDIVPTDIVPTDKSRADGTTPVDIQADIVSADSATTAPISPPTSPAETENPALDGRSGMPAAPAASPELESYGEVATVASARAEPQAIAVTAAPAGAEGATDAATDAAMNATTNALEADVENSTDSPSADAIDVDVDAPENTTVPQRVDTPTARADAVQRPTTDGTGAAIRQRHVDAPDRSLLAQAELRRATGNGRRLDVGITTSDLGRVRVTAVEGAEGLQLQLGSDHGGGRARLAQHLHELRADLTERGLDVGSLDVGTGDPGTRDHSNPPTLAPSGATAASVATADQLVDEIGVGPTHGAPASSRHLDGLDLRL